MNLHLESRGHRPSLSPEGLRTRSSSRESAVFRKYSLGGGHHDRYNPLLPPDLARYLAKLVSERAVVQTQRSVPPPPPHRPNTLLRHGTPDGPTLSYFLPIRLQGLVTWREVLLGSYTHWQKRKGHWLRRKGHWLMASLRDKCRRAGRQADTIRLPLEGNTQRARQAKVLSAPCLRVRSQESF